MLGRPREGKKLKVSTSLRIDPDVKKKIEKRYGSVQKFFNSIINGDIHPYHNYISIKSEVKNESKN